MNKIILDGKIEPEALRKVLKKSVAIRGKNLSNYVECANCKKPIEKLEKLSIDFDVKLSPTSKTKYIYLFFCSDECGDAYFNKRLEKLDKRLRA
jgi:hypothetical protein